MEGCPCPSFARLQIADYARRVSGRKASGRGFDSRRLHNEVERLPRFSSGNRHRFATHLDGTSRTQCPTFDCCPDLDGQPCQDACFRTPGVMRAGQCDLSSASPLCNLGAGQVCRLERRRTTQAAAGSSADSFRRGPLPAARPRGPGQAGPGRAVVEPFRAAGAAESPRPRPGCR
jgi:hypothetical protein